MSNKIIHLYQQFAAASLITRETARVIAAMITNASEKTITLDFSAIQFATRSFFDELYYHIQLADKKTVIVSHLNPAVEALYELVVRNAQHKHSKKSFVVEDTTNVKVVAL